MMKTIKKITTLMVLFFLMFATWTLDVSANSGPPSNVDITIIGMDESYELDIFIYQENALTPEQISQAQVKILEPDFDYIYYQEAYPDALIDFQDQDHYVSNTLYGGVDFFYGSYLQESQSGRFVMFLEVPLVFKIVLVNEDDELIISPIIDFEAYDYEFTWDLNGVSFTPQIQYDAGSFIDLNVNPFTRSSFYIELVIRLVVTLIIEGLILYVFGYRKKFTYQFFVGLNILTQIGLTVGLMYSLSTGMRGYGTFFYFFFGEVIIFMVETILMSIAIKEKPWFLTAFVVILGNLASLIFGFLITAEVMTLF